MHPAPVSSRFDLSLVQASEPGEAEVAGTPPPRESPSHLRTISSQVAVAEAVVRVSAEAVRAELQPLWRRSCRPGSVSPALQCTRGRSDRRHRSCLGIDR